MNTDVDQCIDASLCPLCGKENACINLGCADDSASCWCNNPDISFPEALLAQVPAEKQRKACICKACAQRFVQQA